MRKKYFAFIMAAAISAALLTACGGTGTDQNGGNGSKAQNGAVQDPGSGSTEQNAAGQDAGNGGAAQNAAGQDAGNGGAAQNAAGQGAGNGGAAQNAAGQGAGNGGTAQNAAGQDSASAVSEEQARSTALADAGVTEEEITGIRVKKDHEDGRQVYDVEFYSGNKEYDYEIDASTGSILSSDFDIDDDFKQGGQNASGLTPAVSQEEASAAALAKVPGAGEKDLHIKLDDDDGKLIYEGDIYYNGTEYEFEIDAATGDFLEWSQERD